MKVEPMLKEEVMEYVKERRRNDYILNILSREAKDDLLHWYDVIVKCCYCPFNENCEHENCEKHIKNYITKGDINYEHKS